MCNVSALPRLVGLETCTRFVIGLFLLRFSGFHNRFVPVHLVRALENSHIRIREHNSIRIFRFGFFRVVRFARVVRFLVLINVDGVGPKQRSRHALAPLILNWGQKRSDRISLK